jgi:DNA-binding MarR family transcriptional regulator
MIDRLEQAGHVVRTPHPTDRRSLCVAVTPETHLAAREQVGRHHAARFGAAARLSAEEREVVIRFLAETANDLEDSIASVGERTVDDA